MAYALYNFRDERMDALTEVEILELDDETVAPYRPAHPLSISLYSLLRVQGFHVDEALVEVLRLHLQSASGLKRLIPRRSIEV
jgi:hypothetical protein